MNKFLLINYNAPETAATTVPYLWLTLKSYFQRNSINPSSWEWLNPIYSPIAEDASALVNEIVIQNPDVIGISCYVWNDKLTLHIAEQVKKKLPNVKIIAGGPALYYEHNVSWFVKHWYIDAICEYSGYGEIFITDYLDGKQLSDIPFAIYPSLRRAFWRKSDIKINKREFKWPSPYLDNIDYLKRFKELHNDVKVILDTSRGCPYSCSFCEWGGGTSTKVSFKPADDSILELETIFEILQPKILDIINANYGINDFDIEYTEKIVELNAKYNCAKDVALYGPTKTKKENLLKIYTLFVKNNLMPDGIKLSVQNIDNEVHKNIKRIDMPYDEQLQLFKSLSNEYNIPLRFEMIMGLPGDTLDTFYKSLAELNKADLLFPLIYEWQMLQSSPAANKEYIEKFKLKIKRFKYWQRASNKIGILPRHMLNEPEKMSGLRNLLYDVDWLDPYDLVVESFSYSQEDWIKMILIKHYYAYLNSSRAIIPIIKYLADCKKIDMHVFYKSFFEEFIFSIKCIKETHKKIVSDFNADTICDYSYVDVGNNLPYIHNQSIFKFFLLTNAKAFYDAFYMWFKEKYGEDEYLNDLCTFLTNIVKTPLTYNNDIGKRFSTKYDWKNWMHTKMYSMNPKLMTSYYLIDEVYMNWDSNLDNKKRFEEVLSMCSYWQDTIFHDEIKYIQ